MAATHVEVGTTEGFGYRFYDLHTMTINTSGALSLS